GAHHVKTALKTELIEVIKKQSTDTTRFLAVRQVEVFVTGLLEARVNLHTGRITGIFRSLVPVTAVVFVAVVGRQIVSATEPPNRLFTGFFCNKKAEVGV